MAHRSAHCLGDMVVLAFLPKQEEPVAQSRSAADFRWSRRNPRTRARRSRRARSWNFRLSGMVGLVGLGRIPGQPERRRSIRSLHRTNIRDYWQPAWSDNPVGGGQRAAAPEGLDHRVGYQKLRHIRERCGGRCATRVRNFGCFVPCRKCTKPPLASRCIGCCGHPGGGADIHRCPGADGIPGNECHVGHHSALGPKLDSCLADAGGHHSCRNRRRFPLCDYGARAPLRLRRVSWTVSICG